MGACASLRNHSSTWHPTEITILPYSQPKVVLDLSTLKGAQGRVGQSKLVPFSYPRILRNEKCCWQIWTAARNAMGPHNKDDNRKRKCNVSSISCEGRRGKASLKPATFSTTQSSSSPLYHCFTLAPSGSELKPLTFTIARETKLRMHSALILGKMFRLSSGKIWLASSQTSKHQNFGYIEVSV